MPSKKRGASPARPDHPVTAYARAVVDGQVQTGRAVRLACARHLRDLDTLPGQGYVFDAALASHALAFFPDFLRLAEGEHEGLPFILQPWQQFIIGSLFGWLGPDGFRRFRTAYIEAGKGCGKTPLLAGVGLYALTCDNEASAEVYAAAVKLEQAGIMFSDARKMAEASPDLKAKLVIGKYNIAHYDSGSFFRPISSERRSLDGKRVHVGLVDELHEHDSDIVVDKIRAGIKGRRQGMLLEITNSGYNRNSVCYRHHDYSLKILRGVIENETWFAYVCQLDACALCEAAGKTGPQENCADCDDWRDETVWLKANPNLDIAPGRKYLREQVNEAIGMPSKQNIVQRLNFCIWTESLTRWLPMDLWDLAPAAAAPEALRGRVCFAGLDLSSTQDLSAAVLVFPDDAGGYDVLAKFWVPEDNIRERERRDGVPYGQWVREGFIEATPGNRVDYDTIRVRVQEFGAQQGFEIREIGHDPWNATQLVTQLTGDGATMVPIRQGFASLSAPTKEVERLVLSQQIRHGGHPVLRWCIANAMVELDAAGNVKLSKAKSTERIDGAAALVNAIDRASRHDTSGSIYERHGLVTV